MSRPSVFLRSKIYRRTFLMYVLIVLIATAVILSVFYNNIKITGQTGFESDADLAFRQTETQLAEITRDIDVAFTRLYASPTLLADFYDFFGATPAQYARARLGSAYTTGDTYLGWCSTLVQDSGYAIRHIVYYTSTNLVDLEYSDSGYTRQRIIDAETAEALCDSGIVYTRDIHQDSAYVGKVSFVLDITHIVSDPFCGSPGHGVLLNIHGIYSRLGDTALEDTDLPPSDMGIVTLGQTPVYYATLVSEQFGYTAVYTAPTDDYLRESMSQFAMLAVGLGIVFALVALLLIRQFSKDSAFIQTILHSMEQSADSVFVPVELQGRDDEFSAIAEHLNDLYRHLDTLIQQKYQLTIRQQQTQMDMLSAQLNPHFLYNTLERIRMRAVRDGATEIAEATADLGLLYRNIVKTEPIITISRELEITKQYLDLMSFLYGEQFMYYCDVPEELGSTPTPKIWMQPITENFFKHNFRIDEKLKVIVISAEAVSGGTLFRFFGNQGHIEDEKLQELNAQFSGEVCDSSGIGLQNVYHRLRLFYGDRIQMSIHNGSPAGVCIEIILKEEETS